MRRAMCWVGAGVLLLCAGAAAGEDAPLLVELDWVSGRPAAHFGREVKLEADEDGETYQAELSFGPGATLAFLVEERNEEPELFIDRDFDGNLAEEKPVDLQMSLPDAGAFMSTYLKLRVEATEEVQPPWAKKHGIDGSVRIHITPTGSEEAPAYRVTVLLHRRGRVALEGRMRMVTAYDGDGDLCFDDPERDLVFLDADGDRSITMGQDSPERVRPGRPIRVRSGSYALAVEGRLAARLRLARSASEAQVVRPWTAQTVPPAGLRHEGEFRPLEQIQAAYTRLAASRKRGRTALVELPPLIQETGRVGTDEALAFLQRVYKSHRDVLIRTAVAKALGDVRFRDGAPFLRRMVTGAGDPDVAIAALEALHRMDAPGREKFLVSVAGRTKDSRVFRAAVLHLAYLGTPRSRDSLRRLIKTRRKRGPYAREAYLALTRFSPEAPSDALITLAAAAPDRRLRALLVTHASTLPYPRARDLALACLKDLALTPVLAAAVVEALGRAGDAPSVRALLRVVPGLDEDARDRMARLLRPVRDGEATDLLMAALTAKEPVVRAVAAEIAAGLSHAALPDLVVKRIAAEKDTPTRRALAHALRTQWAPSAGASLLRVLAAGKLDAEVERDVLTVLIRRGLDDPKVVAFLLERARKSRWEARLRLMDAAVAQGAAASAPILLAGLDDERWQIRMVAAQGLQVVRVKAAVVPLIDRLETEEKPRVRKALELALFKTTGMNLYDQVKVWRRWWTEKGAGFLVPAEVGEPPSSDRDGAYGTFFGLPVDLQRVIFVLDQSGSMDSSFDFSNEEREAGTDFQRAVRQTMQVVKQLPDGALINVIFFESDIHPWKKGLVELGKQTRKALDAHMAKQRPMGATNLYDALEMAVKTPGVETIYVLSDGSPNGGKYQEKDRILEAIGELNWGARAVIHCVAMGLRSDLLRDLAAENEGTYVVR